jgi:hypothetical protein
LDLPPEQRFKEVATHYKDGIVATMDAFIGEYYYPAQVLVFLWKQIYWIW